MAISNGFIVADLIFHRYSAYLPAVKYFRHYRSTFRGGQTYLLLHMLDLVAEMRFRRYRHRLYHKPLPLRYYTKKKNK